MSNRSIALSLEEELGDDQNHQQLQQQEEQQNSSQRQSRMDRAPSQTYIDEKQAVMQVVTQFRRQVSTSLRDEELGNNRMSSRRQLGSARRLVASGSRRMNRSSRRNLDPSQRSLMNGEIEVDTNHRQSGGSSVTSDITASTGGGGGGDRSVAGGGASVAGSVSQWSRRPHRMMRKEEVVQDDDDDEAPQPGAYFSGPRRGTQVPVTPWSPESILSHAQQAIPQQLNLYAEVQVANRNDSLSTGQTHTETFNDESIHTMIAETKLERQPTRWFWVIPVFILLIICIAIAGVMHSLLKKGSKGKPESEKGMKPCSFFVEEFLDACINNNQVYEVPSCVNAQYENLTEQLLQGNSRSSTSIARSSYPERCSTTHQALVIVAAAKVDYPIRNDDEFYSLASIYVALKGLEWTHSEYWLVPFKSPCTWYGVKCDQSGAVSRLVFDQNKLRGTLPFQLGHLTNLKTLFLAKNAISGLIPPEIGHLEVLEKLTIDEAAMVTTIPTQFGRLSSLRELKLFLPHLEGSIPSELAQMDNLEHITIRGHLLGEIPTELGTLSQLTHLEFDSAGLRGMEGKLPSELGSLSRLEHLLIHSGNFEPGPIPGEILALTSLKHLFLSDIERTGTLPILELTRMSDSLEALVLIENKFTGTIPSELGTLTNLIDLFLGRNHFTGTIPTELGGLLNLTRMLMPGNALTGTLPSEIGLLSSLVEVDFGVGENLLSGTVPTEICDLKVNGALASFVANFCQRSGDQQHHVPKTCLVRGCMEGLR